MPALLTLVKINSVTVTSYTIGYEHDSVFGDEIGTVEIKAVKTITAAVTLAANQTVEIWRGATGTTSDEKIFSGYLETYIQDGGLYKIKARDKLWTLVRQEKTRTFLNTDAEAGKFSEIFKTLVTGAGLSADSTTVQDSGTAFILKKFVCNHDDPFDKCKELADALDWQFYYKAATDKVYFEPKGFSNYTATLTVGSNVINVPVWKYDVSDMINDVTIVGSFQVVTERELKSGTGAQTSFTLSYEPESTEVYVGGVFKTGQVEGSTASADYYVDKKTKTIRFATAPASGSSNIQIDYGRAIPTPVHLINSSSVATYGTFKKTFILLDVKNTADAENRARKILQRYSTPFRSGVLHLSGLSTASIAVGQNVTVSDTLNGVSGQFTVTKYTIKYPTPYDEVHVGDKEWRLAEWQADMATRVFKLEQKELLNEDYLLEVVSVGTNMKMRRKSLTIQTQTIADSFVLGHPVNGILGTSLLGDRRGAASNVFTVTYF